VAKCMAVVEGKRIQLIIQKGDEGYEDFSRVLTDMDSNGATSWYGDVTDEKGKEQSGLVITSK